jgi:outer membrane receptor protein involved in Fe transport
MGSQSAKTATLRARRCRGMSLTFLAALIATKIAAAADSTKLTDLPIEELLTLEIYSASKFVQKASEAPSAVSVVTAADIKTYGWRTLADALRSMRGLYVSNDRNYSYLGTRGFLRPGDYNTRFLLLIDGYRLNDGVFDQAPIGNEFPLDMDLVERVEFVPGPGSSIYGANAFFGVINVITKRARDMSGVRTGVEAGSYGKRDFRASYGARADNGAELLLAASSFSTKGEDIYSLEFDTPKNNNGTARGLDYDRGHKLFAKVLSGPFNLSFLYGERTKGVPTASFEQVFNDPRSRTVDMHHMVDAGYRAALADDTEFNLRLYAGSYEYLGDYVYDRPPVLVNRDGATARWWGGELKLVSTGWRNQKIIAGIEYQDDYRRDQFNFDVQPVDAVPARQINAGANANYLDDHRRGNRAGVYLQDEIMLRSDLLLNAGLRYDRNAATGGIFNPRLGLIYTPAATTTIKALYGSAYRPPNAYESYYMLAGAGGQHGNPDLKPEHIRSHELVVEQYLTPDTRVTASLYRNNVTDLITQVEDTADGLPVFRNLDRATAKGLELELEKAWHGGARLRASASVQRTVDGGTGAALVNVPRQLAKFNFSVPFGGDIWRAGVEAQYVGRRNTLQSETGGYWLGNLTLSTRRLIGGADLSASIYNLFDRRYADPASEQHVQDAIRQDRRTFRIKLSYAF